MYVFICEIEQSVMGLKFNRMSRRWCTDAYTHTHDL